MLRNILITAIALALLGHSIVIQESSSWEPDGDAPKKLPYPKGFEPARYLGKWYEAARLPTPVQPAGTLATAEYSSGKNEGELLVKNTAYAVGGKRLATIPVM